MKTIKILAHFTPEAWVNDYAIEVDAQGDREWDATSAALALKADDLDALLAGIGRWDEVTDFEDLKDEPNAPEWVRNWHGPFTLRLRFQED